jgi:hypothetical protein
MLAVREDLTLALDRVEFARRLLPSLDGWQEDLLRFSNDRILLNCSRQAGKSSMSALIALHRALYFPGSLVLILAPSERQAKETFSKVSGYYHEIHGAPPPSSDRKLGMHLSNGSRIEALPGSERTVRGFSGVSLLVLDEASRVDDSLFHAVKPMLAVSGGAMIMLSTPHGKRGVFHAAWTEGEEWERYRVTAEDVPRISPEFLAQERKSLPSRIYRQEYECSFEDVEDQVFSYELVEQALSSDVAPLFDDPTLRRERGSVEEEVMPLF